jgi:hypothetical protein
MVALYPSLAVAQELHAAVGAMRADDPEEHSYAWSLTYLQELGEHFAASFSWLNEGHVTNHHRDGHTVQLWARTHVHDPRFVIAAGVGPYRYFDTTVAETGGAYSDTHGWGVIYSLTATWQSQSRWSYQLRMNRIETTQSTDTTSLLLGIGYRLGGSNSGDGDGLPPAGKNEVALLLGQTIVNSFNAEHAVAKSMEYRLAFGRSLRASLAWIDEGDARLIRRNGVALQGWLEPEFLDKRFTVGIGFGPYVAIDQYRNPDQGENGGTRISGILTMTTSYRFGQRWLARFSFNRIVTKYDRDSDMFLLGVGYRF